jgi:hypothetical protein
MSRPNPARAPRAHWNRRSQIRRLQIWDGKYHEKYKDSLPASVHEKRDELTGAEKAAIVRLGFYAYEDYRKLFKDSVKDFADYSY